MLTLMLNVSVNVDVFCGYFLQVMMQYATALIMQLNTMSSAKNAGKSDFQKRVDMRKEILKATLNQSPLTSLDELGQLSYFFKHVTVSMSF